MKNLIILFVASSFVYACGGRNENKQIRKALDSFQLEDGLRIELVASEPLVIDPVAFAFDEDKRMYVVEDRGYPDPAEGGNASTEGVIALLEDTDGDGVYDQRHDFVTGLTYPNGVLPWQGGVFVTCAPHIYYFKDTDGDGIADVKKIILTGFNDTKTAQIRMSHPTLGPDGWVYVTGGLNGGTVTSPEYPEREPVVYTAADGRFHPETFEFQVTGGKSQFGLTIDPYGRRFGSSNRHPVMQIVMEPGYLGRNPSLAFSETIQNVSAVEADAVVYPISSAVTTADYIPNLIGRSHAGTFTAASGLVVFHGTGLTPDHQGNIFICESAQNLVQRQVVSEDGASFRSEIAEHGKEFLASTDEWFRPVFAQHGPDGSLYIADMHRKVIDHPSYVPKEMRDKLDFESGKTDGRIYRVVREDFKRGSQDTIGRVASGSTVSQVVRALSSREEWRQATAFRLLLERKPAAAVPLLKEIALNDDYPASRSRAFWLLRIMDALDSETWEHLFKDKDAAVCEQAVQLTQAEAEAFPNLVPALIAAAQDESPRVRYLAALAMGDIDLPEMIVPLATIAAQDGADKWTRAAVLSGISGRTTEFLSVFGSLKVENKVAFAAVMQDLGQLLGHSGSLAEARSLFDRLVSSGKADEWRIAALYGLADGLSNRSKEIESAVNGVLAAIGNNVPHRILASFVDQVKGLAVKDGTSEALRVRAISLLGFTTYSESKGILNTLLDAQYPPAVQLEAIRTLSRLNDPRGAMLLTDKKKWTAFSPKVKPAVISALTGGTTFIPVLFAAIENGTIAPAEISSVDRKRLMKHQDTSISERANELFKELEGGDRMSVYQSYREVLDYDAHPKAGAAVFQSHCAVCHTYAGKGGQVGPDLTGVKNQPPDALLLHTLVPNYEVYPAYQSVVIRTKSGTTVSGRVASETENSLTLRTAFGSDETILRSQIESLTNSGISLMPEGLEQTMTREELANLIAYLKHGDGE
ncbi:PVC-type heme-binding CxxCH protein [Parapedobacter sp. 10938]|uniref:PVC-type heme-binding CxxCH protein n=1 Tax=Parapedobacter flavus TaxID=3110225 RepID=UPI002DB74E5B|nr:PVC-type heme-binding CxxCH protein [Parapedobacter sp. 10938]MEC3878535.1 PVC-type heme-binding CxxCH protein [Parapedobacter sp. 10938]